MEWQTAGALVVVVAVALALARWKIRALRRDMTTPCAGSCSCGTPPRSAPDRPVP